MSLAAIIHFSPKKSQFILKVSIARQVILIMPENPLDYSFTVLIERLSLRTSNAENYIYEIHEAMKLWPD